MRLNGYGYTRRAIADQLSVPVEDLDRVARREVEGDQYVEALQALLDRGRPAPGDIPKPQGLKVSGAEHIPPPPAPEPVKPASKQGDTKPLTRDEATNAGAFLPAMLKESFMSMDQTLLQVCPIWKADGTKLEPDIWSTITDDECQRLAQLMIGIGQRNVVIATAIRYADRYNNVKFVAELLGPRIGGTGTYIAGSIQQGQQRRRAERARARS